MATSNTTAGLGEEIYRLHTIDALLAGISALAESGTLGEITRICEVARERLSIVSNNLDLIDIGCGEEVQHG